MEKILYIGNRLNSAKATVTSVETLGNMLRGEGYTVFMASSAENKWLRLLDMCQAVFKYRKKTDVVLIDTYSTQNFYYAVAVGFICTILKKKYIPILRGGNLPERIQKSKKLSNMLFRNAAINVAPSNYLFHYFKKAGYNNLILMPNTVHIEKYPFFLRKKTFPKLLWVRSFAKIYNPEMALRVLEILLTDYPDAELCMVGPDKDGSMEKCKEYAVSNKLPVLFTGKLSKEDWTKLSENYDIFINTTHFDNTPISVIEAMALGLPVVTTAVGGIPYLLEQDEALLVADRATEEMAEAVKVLITHPEKSQKQAVNARKKAETFDWDKVKLAWNDLFLRL